jgi:hypothetical protein
MSASSDVERELAMLKGELTAGAPKQLEGSSANGDAQGGQAPQQSQQAQEPYAPQYTAPQQSQDSQQAQSAGLPVSDLPGLDGEPRDGERS